MRTAVLTGFFRDAPQALWPTAVAIEHLERKEWLADCIADMVARAAMASLARPAATHAAGKKVSKIIHPVRHTEFRMIDHMGFSVSDYERAKAFYLKALAPLGYSLVMEVPGETNASGYPAAGIR